MEHDLAAGQLIRPHSIGQSLILHLLPGALLTAFFFLTIPLVKRVGFPPLFALILAILIVLVPFELGVLFYEGKKRNGTFSLRGVVLNREKIPLREYLVWVPLLFLWLGICFSMFSGVDDLLIKTVFSFMPPSFLPANWLGDTTQYSRTNLIVTASLFAVANVLTGPVVEELYFRGYLLPRLSRLGRWAPLVNVVLFSLYHFFSPWQQLSRILGLLPAAYVVQRKQNLFLSMIPHCLGNLVSTVSMIVLIFKA